MFFLLRAAAVISNCSVNWDGGNNDYDNGRWRRDTSVTTTQYFYYDGYLVERVAVFKTKMRAIRSDKLSTSVRPQRVSRVPTSILHLEYKTTN